MANRNAHKKLRAEVRARMAATGESYQQARARILAEGAARPPARVLAGRTRDVDLVPIKYFGASAVLATFEITGRLSVLVVTSGHHRGAFPGGPIAALALRGSRGVH